MKGVNILLADPDESNAERLKSHLISRDETWRITLCADGKEAFEHIKSNEFDIVIMDFTLPGMDGIAILENIRALRYKLKLISVIAMLPYYSRNVFDRAELLGSAYCMTKPVDPECIYRYLSGFAGLAANVSDDAKALHVTISNLLLSVGITPYLKGYLYIREAVKLMYIHGADCKLTKKVYPVLAKLFHSTAQSIERAIRHSIEMAWGDGRLVQFNMMYGAEIFAANYRPTNGEFLSLLIDRVHTLVPDNPLLGRISILNTQDASLPVITANTTIDQIDFTRY